MQLWCLLLDAVTISFPVTIQTLQSVPIIVTLKSTAKISVALH
jgi:hypothetical protein